MCYTPQSTNENASVIEVTRSRQGQNEELLPGLRLADSSLACRRPDSSEFGRVWSGLVVCYSVTVFGGVGSSWITSSGFKI